MGPKARAPKAVETMTEYEMEREARLAKNREVLQRLGVPRDCRGDAHRGRTTATTTTTTRRGRRERERKRKARAREPGGGEPARRSTRASTVATRTGRFYVGEGDAGDDDDDSFDGSEDDEDADGSTDDDDDDDDDGRTRRRREAEGGPEETGARARATRDRREPAPTPQPGDPRQACALRRGWRERHQRQLPTTEPRSRFSRCRSRSSAARAGTGHRAGGDEL